MVNILKAQEESNKAGSLPAALACLLVDGVVCHVTHLRPSSAQLSRQTISSRLRIKLNANRIRQRANIAFPSVIWSSSCVVISNPGSNGTIGPGESANPSRAPLRAAAVVGGAVFNWTSSLHRVRAVSLDYSRSEAQGEIRRWAESVATQVLRSN